MASLYQKIKEENFDSSFAYIETLLRIFLSMMVTNCTGERSFSKLALIKNELRSTMTQEKLNNLSLISIEFDMLEKVPVDSVIDEFSTIKCRKVIL